MKRYIAHITLSALAGAGLTYIVLTATPLRAQVLNRPLFQSQNAEFSQVMPGFRQRGRGAGQGRRWNGSGPCPMYNGVYDPSKLETISGRVVNIEQFGAGQGTWLQVQTDQETVTVHLGPAWYLDSQEAEIAADDTIEVTGTRGTWDNGTTFVASEIKSGDRTIELRDDNGYPMWMNWQTGSSPAN